MNRRRAGALEAQLLEVATWKPPRPRSRPGLVDLAEWRGACIAAGALRTILGTPHWLTSVRVAAARRRGLELRVEILDGALVPACLPRRVGDLPVRITRRAT